MAQACFRRVDKDRVTVNVFLPDRIFDHSGSAEKLVTFEYNQKINILSQAMAFVDLIRISLARTLLLHIDPGRAVYTFSKGRKAAKGHDDGSR